MIAETTWATEAAVANTVGLHKLISAGVATAMATCPTEANVAAIA